MLGMTPTANAGRPQLTPSSLRTFLVQSTQGFTGLVPVVPMTDWLGLSVICYAPIPVVARLRRTTTGMGAWDGKRVNCLAN